MPNKADDQNDPFADDPVQPAAAGAPAAQPAAPAGNAAPQPAAPANDDPFNG
ncbi:MAG: hypothetical protein J5I93_25990 [Pirellulaceae bacterium]|nr:hypothetical protein [Pirellulaceae bacterium]